MDNFEDLTRLSENLYEDLVSLVAEQSQSPSPTRVLPTALWIAFREPTTPVSSSSESLPDFPTPDEPAKKVKMANIMMNLVKPVSFSGEKSGVAVSEFLDTLELTFIMMDGTFTEPRVAARVKLLTFQNLLEGKAKTWWYHQARPEQKISYETGAAALRLRFPETERVQAEELGKAMASFNVLKQDGRSVDEYVEHLNELHAVLGDDFQNLLAMRFIDGIENDMARLAVDAQVEEPYTVTAVVNAYRKATKAIRRQTSYVVPRTGLRTDDILRKDPMREMLRSQERLAAMYIDSQSKFVQQVQEAFKVSQGQAVNQNVNPTSNMVTGQNTGLVATGPSVVQGQGGNRPATANDRYQTGYRAGGSNWTPTCVVCGQRGHLSRDCNNPPLPIEEQNKLWEKHLRPIQSARPTGQPIAVSMVEELTADDLGVDGYQQGTGIVTMPVSMVEEWSGHRVPTLGKGGKWEEMIAALSGSDRAELIAAAEKRRLDSPDETSRGPPRPFRTPEEEVDSTPPATRAGTAPSNPREGRPFVPDPRYASTPQTGPAPNTPNWTPAAAPRRANGRRAEPVKRVIRMMNNKTQWDALEALRKTPVVGLDWGNLLALAPSVKALVCKGLVLVEDKGKQTPAPVQLVDAVQKTMSRPVDVAAVRWAGNNQGFEYGEAIPEPTGAIANFYTTGTITNQDKGTLKSFKIPKVLIDGGAVVNLMPESVIRRLGLPCESNDDIVIRTATNELHPVLKLARFNIEIAGVLASVKVYVIDQPLSYSMILGRRWMQQVRALGDYKTHSYIIFDQRDQPHVVPVSNLDDHHTTKYDNAIGLPEVLPNPGKTREQFDLTDAEYEELAIGRHRMDALLNQIISEAQEEIEAWEDEEEESDAIDVQEQQYPAPCMSGKGQEY